MPGVLAKLIDYFAPLATRHSGFPGGVHLSTPEVNVLGLNAAYLGTPAALHFVEQQGGQPRVVASEFVVAGQDVGGVRVGTFVAASAPPTIQVEQVSRLQLWVWSQVLAEAHDTPEWGGAIARHLARKLEGERDSVLLLAYDGHEPVGALLWRAMAGGGAAHLWGTLDAAADRPLLNAAAELGGGELRVSLPDSCALSMTGEQTVVFTLLP